MRQMPNTKAKQLQESNIDPRTEVNIKIFIQLSNNNISIAFSKSTRECTEHPLYTISQFV